MIWLRQSESSASAKAARPALSDQVISGERGMAQRPGSSRCNRVAIQGVFCDIYAVVRDPRSILITGASSGIGAALARAYAAPRIYLALSGRDAARLAAVANSCRERGAEVMEA